jgi:hypothetical protein
VKRTLNRLSARQAETFKKPGRHADGGNLYLTINQAGSRKWVFMYTLAGKQREMGLGGAGKGGVSIATARARAAGARKLLADGIDPIIAKEDAAQQAALANAPTFGKMADDYIAAMKPRWRNPKHIGQWEYTLRTLAAPLRSKKVNRIETSDVLEVLQPLWLSVPETASRLRGRIESVLDAAKAKGYRQGENPARWRGHLKLLLPARAKLTRGHHAALSYEKMPEFMAKLKGGARCQHLHSNSPSSVPAAPARRLGRDGTRSTWRNACGRSRQPASRPAKSTGCHCRIERWRS